MVQSITGTKFVSKGNKPEEYKAALVIATEEMAYSNSGKAFELFSFKKNNSRGYAGFEINVFCTKPQNIHEAAKFFQKINESHPVSSRYKVTEFKDEIIVGFLYNENVFEAAVLPALMTIDDVLIMFGFKN